MRVLHVINDLRVGGAERLIVDLVPRLRAAGVDAGVVTLGTTADSLLLDTLRQTLPPAALHAPEAPLPLRSPRQILRLQRLLRGANIVHSHLFPAQLWVMVAVALLPRSARPRLVTTEHNTTNRRRGSRFLRVVDRGMYAAYERIVVVGEAVGEALTEWQPTTAPRLRVIHPAVDVARFASAAPASKQAVLGVADDTPVVVCVGRYEAQKDQATLIRALAHLPGWHAALVGDGELRPLLEQTAATVGVSDRVHLLGRRADVPALLAMADVIAQPSRYEGWSVAILEAMASGRAPIVASRAPGLVDAVEGRGLLFPPGDAAALAACVRSLRDHPAAAREWCQRASEWVQQFRIEAYVTQHLRLYEEMIADADAEPN